MRLVAIMCPLSHYVQELGRAAGDARQPETRSESWTA